MDTFAKVKWLCIKPYQIHFIAINVYKVSVKAITASYVTNREHYLGFFGGYHYKLK